MEDLPPSRIYIGGLSTSVTAAEITSRLSAYADVNSVEIIDSSLPGIQPIKVTFRGFSRIWICKFILQRRVLLEKMYFILFGQLVCLGLSIYNGSMWKGKKILIEKARPVSFKRPSCVDEPPHPNERLKKSVLKKKKYVFHSPLILSYPKVTDKNFSVYKHWKHGRYGRSVRSMKLRFPDNTIRIIDPLSHKNALEKLFGSEKPKPYHLLAWKIDDFAKGRDSQTLLFSSENELVPQVGQALTDEQQIPSLEDQPHINKDSMPNSNSIGHLFDPLLFKEGSNGFMAFLNLGLFSAIAESSSAAPVETPSSCTEALSSSDVAKQSSSPNTLATAGSRSLCSALEEWIGSMPVAPAFAFNPFERLHQNTSSRLYFCRLEGNVNGKVDDQSVNDQSVNDQSVNDQNWVSQKETLMQDFKDVRRLLLAKKNKRFKY